MDTETAKIAGGDDDGPSALPMIGVKEPAASNTGDDPNVGDEDDDSSSEEDSSSSDEGSSSESDEDEDDDDNTGDDDDDDDGQSNSGLSEYELLRLKRIERNKARLAELGLVGGSIAKKSGHGKKKKVKKTKTTEVPTRNQPKRAKKSALTQEQLHGPSIARYKRKDAADKQSKESRAPKKEKYIPGTCFGCKKEDDEQRIYCAYCRCQYHPNCNEPKVALPLAEGTLFRCGNCEGKSKRLACGFCEPCNRNEDCGGCTYCVVSRQRVYDWGTCALPFDSERRFDFDVAFVIYKLLLKPHGLFHYLPLHVMCVRTNNFTSSGENTKRCQEKEVHLSSVFGNVQYPATCSRNETIGCASGGGSQER